MATISGYTYGTSAVAQAPFDLDDLERLKTSVMFTQEDERYLQVAGEVLRGQIDAILDLWYSVVGATPHLVATFAGIDGQPIPAYLDAVRKRFGQWILDTCERPYDQTWLDYQYEIGLRHHRAKKNQTDGVAAAPFVPLRDIIALIYPITATIKQFLESGGRSAEEIEKMHQAWTKSVVLQVALWSQPYAPETW